jgi:hypothetical protein
MKIDGVQKCRNTTLGGTSLFLRFTFEKTMAMMLWQVALLLLGFCGAMADLPVAGPIETISTSKCSAVRRESYKARLDISYLYLIQWRAGTSLDVNGIERAIADGLVQMLNECDSLDRPQYAVQIYKDTVASKEGKAMRRDCPH